MRHGTLRPRRRFHCRTIGNDGERFRLAEDSVEWFRCKVLLAVSSEALLAFSLTCVLCVCARATHPLTVPSFLPLPTLLPHSSSPANTLPGFPVISPTKRTTPSSVSPSETNVTESPISSPPVAAAADSLPRARDATVCAS